MSPRRQVFRTMFRRLNALEARLGVRLFDRSARGYALDPRRRAHAGERRARRGRDPRARAPSARPRRAAFRRAPRDHHGHAHAWAARATSLGHLPATRWLTERTPPGAAVLAQSARGGPCRPRARGVPCFLADPAPELVRVLPPEPTLAGELWLLTHPDLRRTARVRAFMETLARGLRRERARLEGRAG